VPIFGWCLTGDCDSCIVSLSNDMKCDCVCHGEIIEMIA
jgi:hypothetical protein